MTDTATEAAIEHTPLDILTVTRKVFEASHWTAGTYTGITYIELEGSTKEKVVGCSIGGLRYAALSPMDHALDETWMFANFNSLGSDSLAGAAASEETAKVYLAAIEYLYQAIDTEHEGAGWEEYLDNREHAGIEPGGAMTVWERIASVEDVIVQWNDSSGYSPEDGDDEEARLTTVGENILPAFDRAIALAAAAQTEAAQAETDTTEGS